MAKPKGIPTKQICVRLSPDLFQAIQEYADGMGVSITEMARLFLKQSVQILREEQHSEEEEYD